MNDFNKPVSAWCAYQDYLENEIWPMEYDRFLAIWLKNLNKV